MTRRPRRDSILLISGPPLCRPPRHVARSADDVVARRNARNHMIDQLNIVGQVPHHHYDHITGSRIEARTQRVCGPGAKRVPYSVSVRRVGVLLAFSLQRTVGSSSAS